MSDLITGAFSFLVYWVIVWAAFVVLVVPINLLLEKWTSVPASMPGNDWR